MTPLLFLIISPLPAQDTAREEPVLHALQQWIGEQPEYRDAITGLYAILQRSLSNSPARGQLAAPFQTLALDPSMLQPVLHDTLAGLPAWDTDEEASDILQAIHENFYAGQTCANEPPALPVNLDEAAAQIEAAAAAIVTAFHAVLTPGQAAFLRDNHALMMGLLQITPFGGAFSGENMANLMQYMDILHAADTSPITCAGQRWSYFLAAPWRNHLRDLMAAHPAAEEAIITQYHTPFGRIFFGGKANHNLLAGNMLFIADIGGDDIYALRTQDAWSGLPQLLMDFAGNDTYDSLEPGGYAAGIGSISLLGDFAGNDTYHADSQTQGFGLFGIGLLLDTAGDDEYIAGAMAQGFALYGAGLLLDTEGNDRYQVGGLGQGVGMTEGVGVLVDLTGDDSYLATGLVPTSYGTPGLSDSWSQGIGVGVRFVTPGGVGILEDHAGTDNYTAGSFSQGGGYFFGLGLFRDGGVADENYLGSRYNFGWGAHMGIGYFREEGGNDHYRTRQIVASGLAWDLSLVLFEDLAGDDIYDMGDFSLGASAHRSIALFRDFGGNDIYRNVLPARSNQGPPNLSLFLDTGSGDNVFDPAVSNETCIHNNQFGFLLVMREFTAADTLDCTAE